MVAKKCKSKSEKTKTLTKSKIIRALDKVLDPEIGIPITEMKLIDDVKIRGSEVEITYHLTSPFCPLARYIEDSIVKAVKSIPGVKKVITKTTKNLF